MKNMSQIVVIGCGFRRGQMTLEAAEPSQA